jgi:hypothetical protein
MDKLLVDSWKKHLESKDATTSSKYFNIGLKACRSSNINLKTAINREHLMPMNFSWFNPISKKYRSDITISPIVAFYNVGPIEPNKVLKAEGSAGSEIALVSIANELAKRGYNVYVFHGGETNIYSVPCRDVQYLPITANKEGDLGGCGGPGFVRSFEGLVELGEVRLDHLILWRQRGDDDFKFNFYSKRVYLGCHDFCDVHLSFKLDACVTLTKCHQEHFQRKLPTTKHIITCNGTMYNKDMELPKRIPKKCCYASSYARGLNTLLNMWPTIKSAHPEAELHIWYGRETFGVLNSDQINEIVSKIESDSSIYEHGRVSHTELVKCIASCDFLLYPYEGKSETFSITTATAMQVGTIPIVKKRDALCELMDIQEPDLLDNNDFLKYTIEMMNKDSHQLNKYREELKELSKDYTHEKATDGWEMAFND